MSLSFFVPTRKQKGAVLFLFLQLIHIQQTITMDWIQNLLFATNSVAHTVILYAFVIALGVYLGKLKIFGVSLGVTFVLFVGLFVAHFGFTAEQNILHFTKEFGLILFVYSIGLQVRF